MQTFVFKVLHRQVDSGSLPKCVNTTLPRNFIDTSKPYGAGTLAPHGDVVRLVDGGEDHGLVELSLVLEAAGVRALGGPGHAPLPARLRGLQQLRLQEAEVVVERVVLVEVGVPRVELLTINRRSCTITEKAPTRAFSWLKVS